MRKPLVAGNWKLNGSLDNNQNLINGLLKQLPLQNADVLICPSFLYLPQAIGLAEKSILVGAQDVAAQISGAFTGECSASMLADIGVSHVIIGHSERRSLFGDSDQVVAEKVTQALKNKLIPVLCLGESLEERESGQTEAVVARQLTTVIEANKDVNWGDIVIAYEPVWARRTGKTASPEQAQAVHAFIRAELAKQIGEASHKTRILYGGSVKPRNAEELFAQLDIDGGLIGGASLQAADFMAIAKAARG